MKLTNDDKYRWVWDDAHNRIFPMIVLKVSSKYVVVSFADHSGVFGLTGTITHRLNHDNWTYATKGEILSELKAYAQEVSRDFGRK